MKNLENYGVVSLDAREVNETNGGTLLGLFVMSILVGYFIGMAISNDE